MDPQPDPKQPPIKVHLRECPVCRHAWSAHNEDGACRLKDCWCLYHPPGEDVEAE